MEVVDLQPNRGLAGALRAGLASGLKDMHPDDVIVTMDADNSHNPALIYRMLIQIQEGSDIVIASRFRSGARIEGVSGLRRALSVGARLIFKLFMPIKGVRDYTCGYRAYRVGLLSKMSEFYGGSLIEQEGFGCMAELLLKSRKFSPIIH
ncbi:MAG: hypothetical protein C0594_04595 [Marinilabiliales bacterium]|nr:MAG: hypothetical protein C0594_04595 [Marinilabiliales bacterium]